MTIHVESPKVHSEGGVPVTVKGVAQVKIQGKDLASLKSASEMFLDKSEDEIIDIAKATLDGHQRSMIASKKIEDIYGERNDFSRSVQQSAQTDLIDMGLTLVSYTVQEISDDEGYLDAVGQKNTVSVQSEARKEVAKAKNFSDLKKIDAEHSRQEEQLKNEHFIALKRLDFEIAVAKYDKERYENEAKSAKAGDIQKARMDKEIAEKTMDVKLMEVERETELVLKERQLKELKMLEMKNRADLECEKAKAMAEAYERKAKAEANQTAEKILKKAQAESESIRLQKQSEAEVLQQRAQAFMQFGKAAKLEMVLAILPQLTAEVAGPITENCKKITSVSQDGSVGFSKITSEIIEVVEKVCESVSNISGQSLTGDEDNDRPGPGVKRKVSLLHQKR
jgi:flotillin